MKKFLLLTAIASAASVAAVAPAMAETTTGTFTVGATTTKLCTAPLTPNIDLGEYNGTAAVTKNTTIAYKCTNTTTSTLTATGSGFLQNAGKKIAYTGTPAVPTVGLGVNASAGNVTSLYTATIAADQSPEPGVYTDTVTVLVNY